MNAEQIVDAIRGENIGAVIFTFSQGGGGSIPSSVPSNLYGRT
jgi:hypothetical protein